MKKQVLTMMVALSLTVVPPVEAQSQTHPFSILVINHEGSDSKPHRPHRQPANTDGALGFFDTATHYLCLYFPTDVMSVTISVYKNGELLFEDYSPINGDGEICYDLVSYGAGNYMVAISSENQTFQSFFAVN